ncbi:hypothetical protein AB3R30_06570 [Leptolyngbyaceae cyanobacterium UHCC 1019]
MPGWFCPRRPAPESQSGLPSGSPARSDRRSRPPVQQNSDQPVPLVVEPLGYGRYRSGLSQRFQSNGRSFVYRSRCHPKRFLRFQDLAQSTRPTFPAYTCSLSSLRFRAIALVPVTASVHRG